MTKEAVRERVRKNGPDQLRGLLLTLVIFGHTYAAGVGDDLGKWIIYGFHMPLFFAVSGYLWRWRSLEERTLPDLLTYFWQRMLWQWLLVSVLFNIYQGNLPANPRRTVGVILLEPSYHLWFIPALVLMVVLTHVVIRAGCGRWTLAGLAVVCVVLWELPVGKGAVPESLHDVDKRYFAYFIWFLLGFAIRNLVNRVPPLWVSLPLALVGLGIYGHAYGRGAWEHDIGFGLLNVGLILAVPAMFAALDRPLPLVGDAMITLGRGSLWVYLLHPFVTTALERFDDGGWRGRVVGLAVTIGVVAASAVLLKLTASRRSGRHHPRIEAPVEAVPPDDVADAVDLPADELDARSGAARPPGAQAHRADAYRDPGIDPHSGIDPFPDGDLLPDHRPAAEFPETRPVPTAQARHRSGGTVGPEILDLPRHSESRS